MELAEKQKNKNSIISKNSRAYKNRQEFYKYILFMGLLLALCITVINSLQYFKNFRNNVII